jgi:spore germination protein GerM
MTRRRRPLWPLAGGLKMPSGRAIAIGLSVVVAAALGWMLVASLPGSSEPEPIETAEPVAAAEPEEAARRINAQLFYVASSGGSLVAVEHDVPYAENQAEQARAIVRAQLSPPEPPHVSAIPKGTELRALFLTPRGEAYVDLSREVVTGHAGGSVNELLTIYTIVHALTANLPAVSSVQILVDGREVETLAGHVNLQRPLYRNPDWIQ